MSENQPVVLEGIPVFTGDLAVLDTKVTALGKDGEKISTATADIHSSFGGLQAFYKAPEADQLFATTKPVADRGASLKSDLATITGALSTYSDEAFPLVKKLERLKDEARTFLGKVKADDKWREDGDLVEENNNRRAEIAETWAAFQAVERACHNKIIALVPDGKPLKTDDGSGGEGMYGYDAEALKHAKGLPWGDPVEESKPWYHLHEHGWDFLKGVFVDGVWGTIKGLGTLVGTDGWESMKQAWTGLAKLATGVAISSTPLAVAFWTTPEEKLPSWLRDSRTAMKETGKALLAWDQWSENPSRAAGAVTFNVVTTVFTGGTGGAVAGGGKAALAAKALSFAGKAGRAIDPMTYLFKGAGAGLTKISDVMAGLKGMGNIEVPTLAPGTVTLPDGGFKLADGTLHLPEGAAIPDGAFEVPKGAVKLPEGATVPAGAVDLGDGVVRLPEGMPAPAGSLPIPEGALKLPEGTTALPEGTLRGTDKDGNIVHLDREGNILTEDGTLKQHHSAASKDNPPATTPTRADTDTPLLRTPAEQSALVGVGARPGGDPIRLGSDFGDTGRLGDDLARPGYDTTLPDRTPGGTANNLPGGSAPDNLPTNSLDNSGPGNAGRGRAEESTPGSGGQTSSAADTSSAGRGGSDLPGGPTRDSSTGGSHSPEPGGPEGPGPAVDDATRTADEASRTGSGVTTDRGNALAPSRAPAPPSFMRQGDNPYGPPGSLTPDQIKEIQVYRANHEEGYFKEYYEKRGHRSDVDRPDESGFPPPQLIKDPANPHVWIPKDKAPPAFPAKYHPNWHRLGTADDLSGTPAKSTLDDAATYRHESVEADKVLHDPLAKSKKEWESTRTPESKLAYDTLRSEHAPYHNVMTKATEAYGESVARHHLIPKYYKGAKWEPTAGPRNGNDQFDQVWRLKDDGGFVIIEAKSDIRTAINERTLPNGYKARQGSREYFLDIMNEMRKRAESGDSAELLLYTDLKKALIADKIEYILVKGVSEGPNYGGFKSRKFNIGTFKEEDFSFEITNRSDS
ncbi:hypothetical protein ACFWGE_03255 [Streptomyces bacillaris]|uniref:hypothetical protein n=1 Tax=Streptomyces TaxID=1883 RepID=UPI001586D9EE|nr:hypothetical protein [Streptomyces sp. CAI-24]NUV39990.1 hypothetical protein [Streptomyces sp. CAI-24]